MIENRPESIPDMAFIIFNTVLIEIFLWRSSWRSMPWVSFLDDLFVARNGTLCRVHFLGDHEPQVGWVDGVEPANLGLMT